MAKGEYNLWKCLTCVDEPEFENKDFMKHLQDVHGIDPKTAKGERKSFMHIDGKEFYLLHIAWQIGDVSAIQDTRQKRLGMDKELWK